MSRRFRSPQDIHQGAHKTDQGALDEPQSGAYENCCPKVGVDPRAGVCGRLHGLHRIPVHQSRRDRRIAARFGTVAPVTAAVRWDIPPPSCSLWEEITGVGDELANTAAPAWRLD